ncbi:MAG: hypothetical protein A9Z00_04095 [Thermobacillus sp. ZCTH02-B1]|uniref:hypothetical protein n=1 Tax=Thermobacillus sp. ZCTH02-B1 TaxID=1858795 RepID=UPI000B55C875|nr:hypothetical protein [Thermobacillus sp. ZCTH02-B1]OUM96768.1 MAG: hypothetical protein A9Z00_04095 [Thermobacillus sp. ZCTH02-B1]
MLLAEMLGYADISQLLRIAETYRLECDGHSKHELMQSIMAAVCEKGRFEALLDGLSLEDERFLHSLLFDDRDAFSLEELLARVRSSRFDAERKPGTPEEVAAVRLEMEPAEPAPEKKPKKKRSRAEARAESARDGGPSASGLRETISRFKQYGWLFNGTNGTSRYLFRMPEDLKGRFRDVLAQRLARRLVYTEEPRAYRDEQELLAEDVLVLLDYAARHAVPLTREGAMYKRNLLRLLEALAVREELPTPGSWRFGYGRRFKDYPDRLALLYDYCHSKGYLAEQDGELRLTGEGAARLASREPEDPAEMYRFWIRLYRAAIPNLPALVRLIDRLADRWVTVDSLRGVLRPFVRPFYYDDPDAVLDKRVFKMMLHLGLIRIGEDDGGRAALRMTNAGRKLVAGVRIRDAEPIPI